MTKPHKCHRWDLQGLVNPHKSGRSCGFPRAWHRQIRDPAIMRLAFVFFRHTAFSYGWKIVWADFGGLQRPTPKPVGSIIKRGTSTCLFAQAFATHLRSP